MQYTKDIQDYWDLRSRGFSDAINEEFDSEMRNKWQNLFEENLSYKHLDVLDDGAGAGFFTLILASMGHNVTSIDYSDKMVWHIKENLKNRRLTATVRQMDAHNLAFADESFDAVVQRDVMWNLENPDLAYSEIFRVLKPGGILIISDGNYYLAAHDDEYAKAREKHRAEMEKKMRAMPGNHYKHNPENVDFSIIDKIAIHLPSSYNRRPQWDVDAMIRLGFRRLDVRIDGKDLPGRFVIIAAKPQ